MLYVQILYETFGYRSSRALLIDSVFKFKRKTLSIIFKDRSRLDLINKLGSMFSDLRPRRNFIRVLTCGLRSNNNF